MSLLTLSSHLNFDLPLLLLLSSVFHALIMLSIFPHKFSLCALSSPSARRYLHPHCHRRLLPTTFILTVIAVCSLLPSSSLSSPSAPYYLHHHCHRRLLPTTFILTVIAVCSPLPSSSLSSPSAPHYLHPHCHRRLLATTFILTVIAVCSPLPPSSLSSPSVPHNLHPHCHRRLLPTTFILTVIAVCSPLPSSSLSSPSAPHYLHPHCHRRLLPTTFILMCFLIPISSLNPHLPSVFSFLFTSSPNPVVIYCLWLLLPSLCQCKCSQSKYTSWYHAGFQHFPFSCFFNVLSQTIPSTLIHVAAPACKPDMYLFAPPTLPSSSSLLSADICTVSFL